MPRVERGIVYAVPCPNCKAFNVPEKVADQDAFITGCRCRFFFTANVLAASMSPTAFLITHASMS